MSERIAAGSNPERLYLPGNSVCDFAEILKPLGFMAVSGLAGLLTAEQGDRFAVRAKRSGRIRYMLFICFFHSRRECRPARKSAKGAKNPVLLIKPVWFVQLTAAGIFIRLSKRLFPAKRLRKLVFVDFLSSARPV